MRTRRKYSIIPGHVAAEACPDCLHTKCGEDCVCNCDAAQAEALAGRLDAENRRVRAEALEEAAKWADEELIEMDLPNVGSLSPLEIMLATRRLVAARLRALAEKGGGR